MQLKAVWQIPVIILLIFASLHAADIPLVWDASISPEVAGYKVYVGLAPRTYNPPIVIGNQTTYTVTGLGTGTWHFAVTAFDADGNESDYSNEVSKIIENAESSRCDLNGDSAINALDLQLLVNAIQTNSATGDLNADSKVNVLDLQILANVILGRQSCPQ